MRLSRADYLYATVCYADIFDYPLTDDDIYFRSIRYVPGKNIRNRVIRGVKKSNYFRFLKGRDDIVQTYIKRRDHSKQKWKIAREIAAKFRIIPTIYLVGVTGGLAVNNAAVTDDIDLFFITSSGTVWITRLLVTIIAALFAKRRTPGIRRVSNLICLNMFIGDDSMQIPVSEQDLFSAHEVLQMEPLWSRKDTYRRFLQANSWTKQYLPVAWDIKKVGRNQHPKVSHWWTHVSRTILRCFELPARYAQLWYMSKRRTNEIVTNSVLRFHPRDARVWIKKALEKRLKKRNIPLDIVFYCR